MKQDKSAIITGGSSGLGLAMATQLAAQGYLPILVARDEGRLQDAAATLHRRGLPCTWFSADITDNSRLQALQEQIKADHGQIDFLILNAGVVHPMLFLDHADGESLSRDINVNLLGTINCARLMIPLMEGGSKVLIVSSVLGLFGMAGYSAYCAAKAGLINVAECLRRELLGRRIRVYVACPSDIDTPMYHNEWADMPECLRKGQLRRSKPQSAEEVADKILRRCKGGRFLITVEWDARMLLLAMHVLPRRLRDFILDRMFPFPGQ